MTRDASDWDPLPVEETGLHPGEAQAKLRKPEHAPLEASTQGYAVVRTSAPGAAVTTTRSAPSVRATMEPVRSRMDSSTRAEPPIPSNANGNGVGAPSQSFAQADLLTALQRSRLEMPLTQVPALPMLREKSAEPNPVAPSHGMLQHEAKPVTAPRQVAGSTLANATQQASTARQLDSAKPTIAAKPGSTAKQVNTAQQASTAQQVNTAQQASTAQPLAIAQSKAMAQAMLPFSFAPMPAAAGVDPRQQQPWFLSMPVVEQLRLVRAWQQDLDAASQLAAEASGARGQRMLERFWVAYVVFFVAALPLMLTDGLMGFVRMAMAGCVTGLLWQVVPHTRRTCSVSATSSYVAVCMLPRIGDLVAMPFSLLTALGGAVLVWFLAALGAAHEDRPPHSD